MVLCNTWEAYNLFRLDRRLNGCVSFTTNNQVQQWRSRLLLAIITVNGGAQHKVHVRQKSNCRIQRVAVGA